MAVLQNYKQQKDPNAVKWFFVDWAAWLGTDTIADADWIVPSGITQADQRQEGAIHYIKLSGGTDGAFYRVTSRITTQESQETEDATLIIKIQEN